MCSGYSWSPENKYKLKNVFYRIIIRSVGPLVYKTLYTHKIDRLLKRLRAFMLPRVETLSIIDTL